MVFRHNFPSDNTIKIVRKFAWLPEKISSNDSGYIKVWLRFYYEEWQWERGKNRWYAKDWKRWIYLHKDAKLSQVNKMINSSDTKDIILAYEYLTI